MPPNNPLPAGPDDDAEPEHTVTAMTASTPDLTAFPTTALTSMMAPDAAAFARILEAGGDALVLIDSDWRYAYFNDLAEELHGRPRSEMVGHRVVDIFPEVENTHFWQVYQRAVRERALLTVEEFFEPLGKWFDIRALPIGDLLYVHFRDVTARKQAEERERSFLTDIFMQAPAFMAALRGPNHVFEMANPPYFQLVGHRDIIGKPVMEALPEVVEQGFLGLLDQVYQTGEPFAGSDIPILLQTTPDGPPEERFLDFSYQPLRGADGQVTGILAHGVDLTERKRLEQERERLLEEQRRLLADAHARAERETLLNQIGAAVRAASEPEAILSTAVSTLGKALHADRCYFVRYNQTRDTAQVTPEWFREEAGVEALAGHTFRMSTYSVDRNAAYKAGHTHVVDDVVSYAPENAEPLLSLHLRSLLRVPIEVGEQMRSLTVAMAHEPRHWTEDEVKLVENVAALVRSTLESVHVQQRERRIAQQLQEALQPSPPGAISGLALASFYRAALAEAEVGGDFHDVFDLGDGRFALVVADLSGKGLSAASQVALTRHQLRYALYTADHSQDGALASALQTLNEILAKHALLEGFATLFVGVWDSAAGTLTYVNAGQEPGLIWRAEKREVEALSPTGPVMGGFIGGTFTQRVVTLSEGDVFVLFTDGMTEVGPSRKELLGIKGVVTLFAQCCTECYSTITRTAEATGDGRASQPDPQAVLSLLIGAVESFARREGMRDDLAALVGVRREDQEELDSP